MTDLAPTFAQDTKPPGPWRMALRSLRHNRSALFSFAILVFLAVASLLAPYYARYVAHTDPFVSNVAGAITVGGQEVDIMQPNDNPLHLGLSPIAPKWIDRKRVGRESMGL